MIARLKAAVRRAANLETLSDMRLLVAADEYKPDGGGRMPAFVLSVLLLTGGAADAAAQAIAFTEREVTFQSDTVELSGTLLRPASSTPSPAIVFLHGSGPATRAGARPYAEEFAKLGVASLFFDKRGSGSSGGSWVNASIEDLAGDALAAIQYLKEEQEIDPARIGLWGVSQAGWIGPIAAARSDDVSFMILISGGGATPRESELFSYRNEFDQAGLSAEESAVATNILEDYFDFLVTGEGRGELEARLDSIRPTRLGPLAEQLDRIMVSDENRPNWSWVGGYDPAQDIGRVDLPLLLLFGDRDTEHPTELAVERWRAGLAKASNENVTLMIFPGAGHGIRMREGHTGPSRAPFADGYLEAQLGWLWLHVLMRSSEERRM